MPYNPNAMSYRSFNNLKTEDLLTYLSLVPWHAITNLEMVDDALHMFEILVTEEWDAQA